MEHACTQENRITRIEEAVQEVNDKVDNLSDSVLTLTTILTPILDKVNEHDKVLRGSGGETGMLATVSDISKKMGELYTTIRGQGEDPGMVGFISELKKKLKESADTQQWLLRLVVGWSIAAVLGLVWSQIVH